MDKKAEDLNPNIIRMPNFDYTPEPGGLGKVYFSKMLSHGNAVAQVNKHFLHLSEVDGLTGEEDTYSSLLQRCIRTAITMRQKGITSKDIISICSLNHFNSCVPFIASLFLGAKSANLDPRLSLDETVYLLKQVNPKMIFVGPEGVELIENAVKAAGIATEIVVFGNSSKDTQFSEFLVASGDEDSFVPVEVQNLMDTAVICFSSGSTGLPKGICVNHYSLLRQSFRRRQIGFNTERYMVFATMYWVITHLVITTGILDKGAWVVVPKLDLDTVWNVIVNSKATGIFIASNAAIALCKKGRPQGVELKHLQHFSTGGGFLSANQINGIRKMLPGIFVGLLYAMTETTGICIDFEPNDSTAKALMKKKPNSCGKPLHGFCYKIVDPDTEEILGVNQRGELRLKTDLQMNGYYNRDSSGEWDSQGWLKTGDLAYYDEEQCFFVVDRAKEMLKFWMWQVSPAYLESILLTHPKVKEAVVFGLPHPIDGDHPTALVVLKESCVDDVIVKEIEQYLEERVTENQKLRGGVKVVDQIPVSPTGKIKRRSIRDMVLKGII